MDMDQSALREPQAALTWTSHLSEHSRLGTRFMAILSVILAKLAWHNDY